MLLNLRKLYDWILHWADTPYGPIALFILSFSEASFFPIPPDVLLIALVLGSKKHALKYALICSIASILGAMFGYGVGYFLWWNGDSYNTVAHFFFNNIPGFNEDIFQRIQLQYEQYGFIIIFTAGFTPIPFKVFTIFSGAFNIPVLLFIMAVASSRSTRFFLVSFLIHRYGKTIKDSIDRHFNLFSILFVLIFFGSFILFKYFIGY